MENKCPKCNSLNTHVDKKGFSGKKAVVGAVLAGPLGAAAGTIGSNKVRITCLDCGYSYLAGEYAKEKAKFEEAQAPQELTPAAGIVLFSILFLLTFVLWLIFGSAILGIASVIFILLVALYVVLDHYERKKRIKEEQESLRLKKSNKQRTKNKPS